MKQFESAIFKGLFACITASTLVFSSTALFADAAGQWRNGAHVYQKICSYCHDNNIGPAIKGRELPSEYTSTIVRKGFRAMPAFRAAEIDDEALRQLSNYVSSSASHQ